MGRTRWPLLGAAAWLWTLGATGAGLTAAETAPPRAVAIVDVNRVLARSAAGAAARDVLTRERGELQRKLDSARQEVDKLREELDKRGSLMTADVRRERQDALERRQRDAARLLADGQKDLERREQQLLQRALAGVGAVVAKVARERGLALVVERRGAGVLFATPEVDITDEVVKAYDAEPLPKERK